MHHNIGEILNLHEDILALIGPVIACAGTMASNVQVPRNLKPRLERHSRSYSGDSPLTPISSVATRDIRRSMETYDLRLEGQAFIVSDPIEVAQIASIFERTV